MTALYEMRPGAITVESQELLTLSPEQTKAAQKRERRRLKRIDLQFLADRRQYITSRLRMKLLHACDTPIAKLVEHYEDSVLTEIELQAQKLIDDDKAPSHVYLSKVAAATIADSRITEICTRAGKLKVLLYDSSAALVLVTTDKIPTNTDLGLQLGCANSNSTIN